MGEKTAIQWTDSTANFWWGCFKVSPGCQHCYAETLSNRFSPGIWGPAKTTSRQLKKAAWQDVPRWNRQALKGGKRRRVFVMSMGDFFEDHPQVESWRWQAMAQMEASTMLDFQVLTKRPENVMRMVPDEWRLEHWPAHIWIGTSVENQQTADERIPELLEIPAAVRFLSMEPLLGPVDLSWWLPTEQERTLGFLGDFHPMFRKESDCVDWVIVGGESGPNARPMHPDWARSLRDQCRAAGVPFFFKQWGEFVDGMNAPDRFSLDSLYETVTGSIPVFQENGREFYAVTQMWRIGKKAAGRLLDGREWNEMPGRRHV